MTTRATRISGISAVAAVALVALLCAGGPARAQAANESQVKAAFLYNFAKFAEWPEAALPPAAPIVLCVVDNAAVTKELATATAGRNVDGHHLVVTRIGADGPLRSCHVLYADRLDSRTAMQLIEKLADAPVLSVSDFPEFTRRGGVAHLFVEDGRMRFAVNVDAIGRSKLRLSSRLLSLAVIVKDDAHASQR